MCEVIVEEQLELVNITELIQTNLIKNFTILGRRLNNNDVTMRKQNQKIDVNHLEYLARFESIQNAINQNNQFALAQFEELLRRVSILEQNNKQLKSQLDEKNVAIRSINDELFNTQLQFQQRIKVKTSQLEELANQIKLIECEQSRIADEINKKQNKVEAERILKETEILKDKNNHIETELKVAHHKIEKIEILSQKAERIQAKKQVQILKQIEDRVKKQIKININTAITGSNQPQFQNSQKDTESLTQSIIKRGSLKVNEENSFGALEYGRSSIDSMIDKWSDRVKEIEIQFKEMQQNLKLINKAIPNLKKNPGQVGKQNISSEGIKQKINEIKPELVKIWAKIDTIDDRLSFSEKKMEEKLRTVNQLANLIKENNLSKMEQKMKNLQTEIFTNLKQIRSMVDTKVNITDYEKYCRMLDDRITQINQLIYLKSDKLEVKKALLFLESKIKQIILVISEDEENEKDALLTKKQLKCISCDKQFDKFNGVVSSPKGNWDGLPYKDHPPQILGRFGMTNYGSLAKKIKKLQNKELPLLNKKHNPNQSFQNSLP